MLTVQNITHTYRPAIGQKTLFTICLWNTTQT